MFPRALAIGCVRCSAGFFITLLAAPGCRNGPLPSVITLVDEAEPSSVGSFTLAGETRKALSTPPGQGASFDLVVPDTPSMRLAIAASTLGAPVLPAPVTFRLVVNRAVVFEEVVRRSEANRWHPYEVDLSAYAGQRVRLELEAESSAHRGSLPLWGYPSLVAKGHVPERPSILLISIDCLRADHLGAYGYHRETTPNLDALAKQAVVFHQAMATSSYTLPTHASMLTGLPPSFHGATIKRPVSRQVDYAPELLARAGYRVEAIVSAPFLSQVYGFERGFHRYRLVSAGAAQLVDEALHSLRAAEGQSHFLFLHFFDVHMPYTPPRELRARFGERPPDITALVDMVEKRAPPASPSEIEQVIALYDGEIAYVDRELGRLFEALRSSGAYDRTLIVVTADHGEGFHEHGAWEHARPWLSGPGLYDEVLHVPLIVKWPGDSTASRVESVVSQVDIFPTLLAVAGLSTTTHWARDLADAKSPRRVLAELAVEGADGAVVRHVALRDDRFKYIWSDVGEELYDLATDPEEVINLAATDDARLAGFRAALRDYLRQASAVHSTEEEISLDGALLEQLEQLGYVPPAVPPDDDQGDER
ncbi:MAG TPA: sulfatase [Vicinamibacteria bacterium]|nr:sulfatase [Vicinamibacteria bacterium]